MSYELRAHQVHAMDLLKSSLTRGKRKPILQMATGAGKTVLAGHIVRGALAKNNRVIFVVPSLSLVDQTVQSFYKQGITEVGVIQADHPLTNYSKPVQVATVQSLKNRKIPHADVVIVDECHVWWKFYEDWFARWDATIFIGLTATPWAKGLGLHYDDLLVAATTQDLIEQGFLSNFRVYAPSKPDLSKVKISMGDFNQSELSDVMSEKTLVADCVSTWLSLGENRPTLVFAVDRAHAKKLQNDFISQGISAGYVDAYTDGEEREEIRKKFHLGEIKVVCNVGCLTTGVDWDVRCIVLARPTKSKMLFVQMIGRGLRTAEGKSDCLILDHSSTHLNLGFVTDIHQDTLSKKTKGESNKSEREAPLPKECGKCKFVKPVSVHECPSCGFAPEKQSDVEVEVGELEELRQKKKINKEYSVDQKSDFYSQLIWLAGKFNYKDGWAK